MSTALMLGVGTVLALVLLVVGRARRGRSGAVGRAGRARLVLPLLRVSAMDSDARMPRRMGRTRGDGLP